MNANIEELILSGKFFSNSRSSSPVRTPSPDSGWHDDEYNPSSDEDEKGRPYQHKQHHVDQHESVGMGPGRTGVKGVIRDRDEATATAQEKRSREIAELNKRMEKSSLGGKTFLEEEREREIERRLREGPSRRDIEANEDKTDVLGRAKEGRFGHLREVGPEGFIGAVEKEQRGIWVVLHLYEPSVDRCYSLDETLSRLAREYPETKFLRSRAAALGFASAASSLSGTKSPGRTRSGTITARSRMDDDDDEDPYEDEKYDGLYEDEEEDPEYDEDSVDTDMLPTMHVYRDGELVYNWVRVDWEAGEAGIAELLIKHRVLEQGYPKLGNCGFPSDDDDEELIWSDEDNA